MARTFFPQYSYSLPVFALSVVSSHAPEHQLEQERTFERVSGRMLGAERGSHADRRLYSGGSMKMSCVDLNVD
jgi:hypothetical protein